VDNEGNVYVGDSGNHTIRKISPTGIVTTFAGSAGLQGSVDGTGTIARFSQPYGVSVDPGGNIYVADYGNQTVRKITSSGAVTTLAGLSGSSGSADGSGNAARFDGPAQTATDSMGNIYVADSRNHTMRKITPAGSVTTLAGSAPYTGSTDDIGTGARFNFPNGIAVGGDGNAYIGDTNNYTIRKIDSAKVVSTAAGTPGVNGSADGVGKSARFSGPYGVAADNSGNVYVADSFSIRKITADGKVTTLAGIPNNPGSGNGTAQGAQFSRPTGIAVDGKGNLFVADTNNNTIRLGAPTMPAPTPAPLPSKLANISTRSAVQAGDNVLIGGFIVHGQVAKKVIVRAIGPSLLQNGVPGALADPVLSLYNEAGAVLAHNDNWRSTQEQEIFDSGIAPTNDLESAITISLLPGNYTAIVRGSNDTTGVALVEVYDLQ
jgi:sugar lactone lactonase YvrE